MVLLSYLPLISYSYGIPYYILILLAISFNKLRNNRRYDSNLSKPVLFFTIILIIFFGLRGFVQTDCLNYYNIYEKIPTLWEIGKYNNHLDGIEPGFFVYSSIIKSINPDFHFWVFVNTLIDIVIFTWFFKRYSTSVLLSWVVFFIFSGLVIELNLYRNAKSICLFLLAIPYIQQRKFVKFALLWICAILFHTSAILYLPGYFILNRRWGKIIPIILLLIVNAIFFLKLFPTTLIIGHFLNVEGEFIAKATGYLSNGKELGISLGYIERLTMFILCVVYGSKLVSSNRSNLVFINSFYIYYVLWYIFSDVAVFVERFPLLFSYSYWILVPNFISICRNRYKKIIYAGLICFLSAKIFILTDHILYRYDNLLFGIESKTSREIDCDRYMSK